MKFGWIIKSVAMAAVTLLLGAGCGGFSSSQSVSPLDFLIPHLGDNKPQTAPPQIVSTEKSDEPVKGIVLVN